MSRPSIQLPEKLAAMIRGLHPELKKQLKAAFVLLLENPHRGKMLREDLAGLRSLRVRKMRIVYRLSAKGDIMVVAIGPRKTIYEETFRLISQEPG